MPIPTKMLLKEYTDFRKECVFLGLTKTLTIKFIKKIYYYPNSEVHKVSRTTSITKQMSDITIEHCNFQSNGS